MARRSRQPQYPTGFDMVRVAKVIQVYEDFYCRPKTPSNCRERVAWLDTILPAIRLSRKLICCGDPGPSLSSVCWGQVVVRDL